jgi:hypothetical protein
MSEESIPRTLEESVVRMVLNHSLHTGQTHAFETAEAQRLTQECAAQVGSTAYSPLSNGNCFPAIVEIDEGLFCESSTAPVRLFSFCPCSSVPNKRHVRNSNDDFMDVIPRKEFIL